MRAEGPGNIVSAFRMILLAFSHCHAVRLLDRRAMIESQQAHSSVVLLLVRVRVVRLEVALIQFFLVRGFSLSGSFHCWQGVGSCLGFLPFAWHVACHVDQEGGLVMDGSRIV